jgi:uncharacterized protein YyaL (SSP411 family)
MPRTLTLLVLSALLAPASAGAETKPRHTNRLSRESSPYLLQHAHNPVDWYPWGPEAFARAKKEGKLVFLSVGYSSCHWCHVMERESFEDEGVAAILNRHFVCIKVDREERPDVDDVYMTALQVVSSSGGGWPLSMFLTADGKPIFGGTYWPCEDRQVDGETVPGFKSILKRVVRLHTEKGTELDKQADRVAEMTRDALAGAARGVALVELDRSLVRTAVDAVKEEFDRTYGGFGSPARNFRGSKFPLPSYLRLLQYESARTRTKDLDELVEVTLDHMARGGIFDQLGGGFHRYSTERTWTVPHFEKMLYDNAQLLEVYADAYRRTKRPQYRRVLEQTVTFVRRELTSPEGAFWSALDADSEGEEGRYYVWTAKEIDAALPDRHEADLFKQVFGADGPPNFEGKYHILTLPRPLAQPARDCKITEQELEARLVPPRRQLFEARSRRRRPFLDTKVLTGWNGQMVAGMSRAGAALGDREAVAAATRAADFVLANLRTREGRLLRTWGAAPGEKPRARLVANLEDHAGLLHGLLTLHDVTGQRRWLDEARSVADAMVRHHLDAERGGFFCTATDQEQLFARAKDQHDSAQPSGNSLAAQGLVRLWTKTGEDRYGRLAEKTIRSLAAPLKAYPANLTALAQALGMYLDAREKRTH